MKTSQDVGQSGEKCGQGKTPTARGRGVIRRSVARAVCVATVWVATTTGVFASDRWETLQAIHLVENPNNSTRMGSKGELGPYQFRSGTWKMHTKKPFYLANNREEADRVAIKHYEWLKRELEKNGKEASPYTIALAWNAGLSATLNDKTPTSSHRYAERVQALTDDLKARQVAQQR